jgi:tripartite-type tricarboxylate transporter receptor subunit TctC
MTGYHGGEQQMAILRGEAHGTIMTWGTFYSFVKAGNAIPVVILADDRPKGLDHVPLLREVVTDEKYRSGVTLLTGATKVDRFFAGPPGIPADRLQILREAFNKAWQDPEALKMAQKAKKPVSLTKGAAVARSVIRNQKQPPKVIELLKEAYGLK